MAPPSEEEGGEDNKGLTEDSVRSFLKKERRHCSRREECWQYSQWYRQGVVALKKMGIPCTALTKYIKGSGSTETKRRMVTRWCQKEDALKALPEQQQKAQDRRMRKVGGGRKAWYPTMEKKLKDWIQTRLAMGEQIAKRRVQGKARVLARKMKGGSAFAAGEEWLAAFNRRHGMQLRTLPKEEQSPSSSRRDVMYLTVNPDADQEHCTVDNDGGSKAEQQTLQSTTQSADCRTTRKRNVQGSGGNTQAAATPRIATELLANPSWPLLNSSTAPRCPSTDGISRTRRRGEKTSSSSNATQVVVSGVDEGGKQEETGDKGQTSGRNRKRRQQGADACNGTERDPRAQQNLAANGSCDGAAADEASGKPGRKRGTKRTRPAATEEELVEMLQEKVAQLESELEAVKGKLNGGSGRISMMDRWRHLASDVHGRVCRSVVDDEGVGVAALHSVPSGTVVDYLWDRAVVLPTFKVTQAELNRLSPEVKDYLLSIQALESDSGSPPTMHLPHYGPNCFIGLSTWVNGGMQGRANATFSAGRRDNDPGFNHKIETTVNVARGEEFVVDYKEAFPADSLEHIPGWVQRKQAFSKKHSLIPTFPTVLRCLGKMMKMKPGIFYKAGLINGLPFYRLEGEHAPQDAWLFGSAKGIWCITSDYKQVGNSSRNCHASTALTAQQLVEAHGSPLPCGKLTWEVKKHGSVERSVFKEVQADD